MKAEASSIKGWDMGKVHSIFKKEILKLDDRVDDFQDFGSLTLELSRNKLKHFFQF